MYSRDDMMNIEANPRSVAEKHDLRGQDLNFSPCGEMGGSLGQIVAQLGGNYF